MTQTANITEEKLVRSGDPKLFEKNMLKVNWLITHRCSFDCSYCFGHDNEHGTFPPLERLQTAVDRILATDREQFQFTLSGGEPTIHPDFLEFMAYLHQRLDGRGNIGILTNLSRKESFYRKLIEQCPDNVSFGCTLHFEQADFAETLKNACMLADHGLSLRMNLLAHPVYMPSVKAVFRMFQAASEAHGFPLKLTTMKEQGEDGSYSVIDSRYKPEDLAWIEEKVTGENTKLSSQQFIMDYIDTTNRDIRHAPMNWDELTYNDLNRFKGMLCNAGVNAIALDEQGNVDPAVCFRGRVHTGLNIYSDRNPFDSLGKPILCPFDKCTCAADIALPKFVPGHAPAYMKKLAKKRPAPHETAPQTTHVAATSTHQAT